MRQLKGKVKETRKQKKERKLENAEIQKKITTVVLPILCAIVALISVYVYLKTRPVES
ncbi:single-pass membrane and coiled-coil domain-containing protein 4 homolog [Episyrphus balteatus]|uniref:single-pass membrane and coiled-coil domain-containing protein 4 homolog n=1 Tax=Episyrphus balteatus TaxID=286459 RepID=UPI002486C869|nr:single-pass membrane and coiled-coil domain-containing protein 4 homolog [Episyrphus balteatus]